MARGRVGALDRGLCNAFAQIGAAQIEILTGFIGRPVRGVTADVGAVQRGEALALSTRTARAGNIARFAGQSVRRKYCRRTLPARDGGEGCGLCGVELVQGVATFVAVLWRW